MTHLFPDNALETHVAILGKTGSGKTYAAKGLVERLLARKARVCVIDPTGAWWGLRFGADGKSAGFETLILGGDHGDLPLPPRGGEAVARLVAEQRVNVVIDTLLLGVGERGLWFTEFAAALFRLNRDPLHLFIDEAHLFMPQGKVPDPQTGKMLHAGNTLMSGGRSRGIRGTLITQRPAKLHKDALTCADALVAMRVLAPQDRQAIKDWIDGCGDPKQGKDVLDSLANMKRGEGWVWWPEGGVLRRGKFPAIDTFDSSAAPTGGGAHKAPKNGAEIDLGEIKKALADAAAEAEANDPKKLRARIAELEREARKKAQGTGQPEGLSRERVAEIVAAERDNARREAYRAVWAVVSPIRPMAQQLVDHFQKACDRINQGIEVYGSSLTAKSLQAKAVTPIQRPKSPNPVAPGPMLSSGKSSDLPGPFRRILASAAYWSGIGVDAPTVSQLAVAAGYAASGSFDTYLSRMGTQGLLVRSNGAVRLTEAGLAASPPADPPQSMAQHHEVVSRILDGPQNRIINALIRSGGEAMRVEDLAAASGYAPSGSFDTYLSRLGTKGLIVRSRGMVTPTPLLFPEGLA